VATSTCEAECIAASDAAKEILWLSKLLCEMDTQLRKITLHVDNQSALTLMKLHHAGTSGRPKHIDVAYHFLRDRTMRGDLDVQFIATDQQKADGLMKVLNGALELIEHYVVTGVVFHTSPLRTTPLLCVAPPSTPFEPS
jgi:hypothetical protein